MTNGSQVCHVVLKGCKSVSFLRIKYAALTTEHNVQKRQWDGFAGRGREGVLHSQPQPTGRPGHMVEAPLLIPALPLPIATSPFPSRVMHPALCPLTAMPCPCSVTLSSCSELVIALHSTGTVQSNAPRCKAMLPAQAVTCSGYRDFPS